MGLVQFGSSISFVEYIYIYIYISRIEVLLLLFDVRIHCPYFSKYGSILYVHTRTIAHSHNCFSGEEARSHSCSCGH